MPLLKREPEIFPQGLFELPEDRSPWFVAHTRSRQEKALARYLESFEVPFYLPVREKRTVGAERVRVSYLPLFPGYLFLRGGSAERLAALRSNLVVRVLETPDQSLIAAELAQLRALQVSGASLEPLPAFVPGDRVRVTEGPFRGHRGTVLRDQGRFRLIVSISMLRQSVAVELDRASLALAPSTDGSVRGAAVA